MLWRKPLIVIIVGDDGVSAIPVGRVDFVPHFVARGDKRAERLLRDRLEAIRHAEYIVLAHEPNPALRHDTLPVLSYFDRHALAKRRLDEAFPRAVNRAYRFLSSTHVLLAAITSDDAVVSWLKSQYLDEKMLGLTALEATALVKALVPEQHEWLVVLLPFQSGGVSLLALKQGELLLARTLPLKLDDTDGLAREVEASLAFLARHGLVDLKKAHLLGLMHEASSVALASCFVARLGGVLFLDAYKAAIRLRLPEVTSGDAYVDGLLAQWIGKYGVAMPLRSEESRQQHRHALLGLWGWRSAVVAAIVVLVLLIITTLQWVAEDYEMKRMESALIQAQQTEVITPATNLTASQMRAARIKQRLFVIPDKPLTVDQTRLATALAGRALTQLWTWQDDGTQRFTLRLMTSEDDLSQDAIEGLRADIARAMPEDEVEIIAPQTPSPHAGIAFVTRRRQ